MDVELGFPPRGVHALHAQQSPLVLVDSREGDGQADGTHLTSKERKKRKEGGKGGRERAGGAQDDGTRPEAS